VLAWCLAQVQRSVGFEKHQQPRQPFRRLKGRTGGEKLLRLLASAYLGLVAQSVAAVNPDVLGETFALLVKFHVLCELFTVESACGDDCRDCAMLTLEELDTMVDSPTPAYPILSVRL
jgi:hypothetical protein